jgi:hypothetical protein
VIEKLRKEADGVVVVDAGDDLSGAPVQPAQGKLRAKLILDADQKVGMDARAVGELDRAAGVDLADVPSSALVERAGIKVGVFAADLDAGAAAVAKLRSQPAALRKRGAQLVVAVVHGGAAELRQVLSAGDSGIDVAVVSHFQGGGSEQRIGGAWVVEARPQAKFVGELDFHILDGKLAFQDIGSVGQYEDSIANYEQALLDVNARKASAGPQLAATFEAQVDLLERQLQAARDKLAAAHPDAKSSWSESHQTALGTDVPDAPSLAPLVQAYKADVAKLPPPPAVSPVGPTGNYAGIAACRGCHPSQVAFWEKTKHAHAWQTLVDKKQQSDFACATCHVTGHMIALHDVQCEACHGPALPHTRSPSVKGLVVRDPPESVCSGCLTPAQSTEWKFAAFRSAIVGRGHGQSAPRQAP